MRSRDLEFMSKRSTFLRLGISRDLEFMRSRGLKVKRSRVLELGRSRELEFRNRSETGQKQVRNRAETGQKQVRNGSETCQKQVRNGSETRSAAFPPVLEEGTASRGPAACVGQGSVTAGRGKELLAAT